MASLYGFPGKTIQICPFFSFSLYSLIQAQSVKFPTLSPKPAHDTSNAAETKSYQTPKK